ncbi:hypothetical protein EV659_107155 [Rhodothalassium salexigens DSM 2132]|uniref:DUF2946 family protein n=1 Tax=Rhodothalassium salexigens DSM 2132 TaxID=1188247 RepID=A0A4R2PE87_RHOSA|nr:hypothetical protein [Rhodothalassium salexigens]MBB4211873.1 hypothetical protein [Rhodothalassium salexigens DSM 2132]MBK1638914.1 hypothetical protein [Rhodothalassium salexigens DSM 2132]TCP33542.1 hypothetical protein EV659_107155 [Rhodothalassium salexigens DSM 2132]
MWTRRRYPQRSLALVAALLLTLGAVGPNLAMATLAAAGATTRAAAGEAPGQRVLLCMPEGMRWVTVVDGVPAPADDRADELPPCPGCVLSALVGLAPPTPTVLAPSVETGARRLCPGADHRAPRGPPATEHGARAPPRSRV